MTDSRDEELFLDDDEDQSSAHFKDFAPEFTPTRKPLDFKDIPLSSEDEKTGRSLTEN